MENYMADKNVKTYYEVWARSPYKHPLDMERFYKFVKVCVNCVGRGHLGRKLDVSYLEASLYDSFRGNHNEESWDKFRHEIVVLFEHLRDYEDTELP